MAKEGKFAALKVLYEQPEAEITPALAEPAPIAPEPGNGRGRPATGKRSSPEWKLYSHFIKRQTQRAAVARLHADDSGRDLSDVIQELLENWLKS